ncbi:MAG: trigger factor [Cyanobacteria bacterium J06641_5]
MKVTLEKVTGSKQSLGIEISPEASKNAYEKMVREATKTVNVPGFRRGKAPRQILIQRLGGMRRLKEFALQEVLQDTIQEAIEQEKVEPLSNYDLDPTFEDLVDRYEPGQALAFAVSFDVAPEVPLQADTYKAISVQAEKIEATVQQVDDRLEQLRVGRATLVPVEGRPAQLGDTTIIDYAGYFVPEGEGDRQAIEGASSQDFELELAEGKFLPEIIAGLVGMAVETEKEIDLTFPVDYPNEELAGKAAVFSLNLKEVKEKELPELDDDFAADVSEEHDTLEKLKDFLQKQFEEQAEAQTKSNIQGALTTALVESVEFDLPDSMIDREAQALVSQTAMQMSQYGVDVRKMLTEELVAKMREEARPEAISRLKESLTLQELAKSEGLEPAEEAISTRIAEVQVELAERDYDPERLREVVCEDLAREAALEWLEVNATVELVPEGTLSETEAADSEAGGDAETSAAETASPGAEVDNSATQAPVAAEPS